jgi:uncharacterized protein YbdZ (MbtH family)
MDDHQTTKTDHYIVVVNHEEQFSIWRDDKNKRIPAGWRDVGVRGTKEECLAQIEKLWTDMRPLSVRRALESYVAPQVVELTGDEAETAAKKDGLVERLETEQPITFVGHPSASTTELDAQLERGRVFIRFEMTGTELGIKLDPRCLGPARKSIANKSGKIHLVGDLTLNFNRVRFRGELDVTELRGTGRLEPRPST